MNHILPHVWWHDTSRWYVMELKNSIAVLQYCYLDRGLLYMFVSENALCMHEGRSESIERFSIQRYLLIIGKKQNMVLSHTFTYFSTSWTTRHLSYRDTSLLIPSSYQKAAWPNVHKFCGIANVRWQFHTQLYETLPDIVRTLRQLWNVDSLECGSPFASLRLWWQRVVLISQRHEHLFAHS